jgi:lysophospholipase L1-like esterase
MNDLKNVTLNGDSTRERYESTVREILDGVASVWAPEANCRHSNFVLEHLDEWVLSRNHDLVHINCGLHDLQYMHDLTRPTVGTNQYEANLCCILERMLTKDVRFVWATSAPINEHWYDCKPHKQRCEADVVAYNERSLKVAARYGIQVNDLYGVVQQTGRDTILDPDGGHHKPEGSRVLGRAVSQCVREVLSV